MKHRQQHPIAMTKVFAGTVVMKILLFAGFGLLTTTTTTTTSGYGAFVKADSLDDMVNAWLKTNNVRAASIAFYDGVRILFLFCMCVYVYCLDRVYFFTTVSFLFKMTHLVSICSFLFMCCIVVVFKCDRT